ncbi:MAG: ABC transporter permease [Myxococcota bacterium]|nr:ABC transporter permease [Myxococcota bacterium]
MSSIVAAFGAYALFLHDLIRATIRYGVSWDEVLSEGYQIGVKSLSILLIINVFVGSNLAIQGYNAMQPLGGQRLVGMFVALAGVRELAPIIAAAMVAAKAGTEMASQIGVMRIQEQIDALEVMAINPYATLIAPRMLGIMMVMPALTLIAVFVTLASGYAVSVHQLGLNGSVYIEFAADNIQLIDFLYCEVKALLFGLIICTLSCWFGFNCKKGPEGVGEATNRAVVASAVTCVVVNYFISELLYGGL